MEDLRTSSEWEIEFGILVLDPDGWDRKNLTDSWSQMITRDEFQRRIMSSTITHDPEFWKR